MSDTDMRPDLGALEHLDFAPKCEATHSACDGEGVATYFVVCRCCWKKFFCSACVSLKMRQDGAAPWVCGACGTRFGQVPWLDIVTLHPIGVKP